MEGTMKQLIFKTKGEVELVEVPIPDYGDDGILVKVAYAGICGSDIHAYLLGGLYGGILDNMKFGHEFTGTIVEVGKNVTDFKVGDRVWVDPAYANPKGDMMSFSCMAGGFAEYCGSLKAVKDETVFLIPDNVSMRAAALIEPFGVGVHTKNQANVKAGDKVLMWGAGPIGLMGWAAMKHSGVEDIIVAERMPERIAFAKNLGADVFDNTEADVHAYAGERWGIVSLNPDTPNYPDVDKYIDFVGLGALMGEYVEKGRPFAKFSTLSLDQTPLTINPGQFMLKQLSVNGSRGYDPEDIKEVIEVLQDETIDIARIITSEFGLDEYQEAFAKACDRNSGLKVLFRVAGE